MLSPCVRYVVDGEAHVLWIPPRLALSIELGETAIEAALTAVRAACGTDIRIEFYRTSIPDHCVHRVRVP